MKIVEKLEKQFFSLEQLKQIKVKDNNEKLVDLKIVDPSIILSPRIENISKTGKTIFVRYKVGLKLKNINQRLKKMGLILKIIDGYRLLEVQKQYWKHQISLTTKEHPEWSKKNIEKQTIKFCAKPGLSFHPTGGAVDITIVNIKTKKELPMGTKINTFTPKAYSHYTLLPNIALKNRKLLFKETKKEGFYNYPAEWWHFSYGTTDWALYYKKPCAIYNIKKFTKSNAKKLK